MRSRRERVAALAESEKLDAVLVYGANRSGSGVGWLTGWPVTAEATALLDARGPDLLLVQYRNHVPLATRLAQQFEVRWGGSSTLEALESELRKRGVRRVGVIGPFAAGRMWRSTEKFELVDLNRRYTTLRLVKSAEELDWMRVGAWLSDLAIEALREHAGSGLSERELWRLCEQAYVGEGGTTWIHYFGATSMAAPDCCVPAQYPSGRRLQKGDVLFCEISAQFWEYPGQVLRSFTVGCGPSALYRDLHDTAEAALGAILARVRAGALASELVEASSVIERAGFTTCDDLVHGFGGGYLPPVLGSRSRPAGPVPELRLEAGMTIVVQPNVVARDGRAGVQVGELIAVTDAGYERLHGAPGGLHRLN
jgi:Xaa-Pro dipeptidase